MAMKHIERERVPIECPNPKCVATGWVPINQLDRQMVCKDCGTRFYLDRTGNQLCIGERPKVFVDPLETKTVVMAKPDLAERAFTGWDRLPAKVKKGIKTGLMSAAAIVLLSWIWIAFLRPGPKLPKELSERVVYLVKNLVKEDLDAIWPMVNSGTEGDLKPWIRRVRPKTWTKKMVGYKMDQKILVQNLKQKKGCIEVRIDSPMNPQTEPEPEPKVAEATPASKNDKEADDDEEQPAPKPAPPPAPKPPAGPRPVVFKTVWVFDSDRGWLFDPTESSK
jgi:hypothetical protein